MERHQDIKTSRHQDIKTSAECDSTMQPGWAKPKITLG